MKAHPSKVAVDALLVIYRSVMSRGAGGRGFKVGTVAGTQGGWIDRRLTYYPATDRMLKQYDNVTIMIRSVHFSSTETTPRDVMGYWGADQLLQFTESLDRCQQQGLVTF